MANFYGRTALIGGASGALDELDGADLADGDGAMAIVAGDGVYCYTLDADSGAAEASPDVIAPDTNPGDKRWILVARIGSIVQATSIVFGQTTVNDIYRIIPSGNNLNFERRESGIWVRKGDIRP